GRDGLLPDRARPGDQARSRGMSREFSQLAPLAEPMAAEARGRADLAAAGDMRGDPELREMADEEIAAAQARLAELDDTLMALLVPRDARDDGGIYLRSEEYTSELQSRENLVCRLLLEKKKTKKQKSEE